MQEFVFSCVLGCCVCVCVCVCVRARGGVGVGGWIVFFVCAGMFVCARRSRVFVCIA